VLELKLPNNGMERNKETKKVKCGYKMQEERPPLREKQLQLQATDCLSNRPNSFPQLSSSEEVAFSVIFQSVLPEISVTDS
jgi:hypothetical protein